MRERPKTRFKNTKVSQCAHKSAFPAQCFGSPEFLLKWEEKIRLYYCSLFGVFLFHIKKYVEKIEVSLSNEIKRIFRSKVDFDCNCTESLRTNCPSYEFENRERKTIISLLKFSSFDISLHGKNHSTNSNRMNTIVCRKKPLLSSAWQVNQFYYFMEKVKIEEFFLSLYEMSLERIIW